MKFVEKRDGHWYWTAYCDKNTGYGSFGIGGKTRSAHVVSYELFVGPVPKGLQIDHLCRIRACVNPACLEPVTQRENILRGMGPSAQNAVKTHCKRGHAFTPENTDIVPRGRECKQCHREYEQRMYHVRKQRKETQWSTL